MKYGLPLSVIGHVIVAASGLFFWTSSEFEPAFDSYQVISLENLELGEFRNVSEIAEQAPQPEDDAEDVIQNNSENEEAEPEPEPEAPPPEPQPIPEETIPTPDVTPDPEPEPEPTPEPTPTPPPKTRQAKEQPEKPSIDDLLNDTDEKLRDIDPDRNQGPQKRNSSNPLTDAGNAPRQMAGEGTGNSILVRDMVVSQIKQRECWVGVTELPDWEKLVVEIRFQLDSRGRISKAPERIRPRNIANNDRYMNIASDRAIRAIRECEPYDLPEDKFYLWQNTNIELTFDEEF